jgi:large subunit ribosomal protein L21
MIGRLVALVGAAVAAAGAMLLGRRGLRQRSRARRKAERQARLRSSTASTAAQASTTALRSSTGPGEGGVPADDGDAAAQRHDDARDAPGTSDSASDEPGFRSIKGIGPAMEERLREAGVTSVAQMAEWTDDDVEALAPQLKVTSERIRNQEWVEQARRVVAGERGD